MEKEEKINEVSECILCRSEINPGASKCHSCYADLEAFAVDHKGTCPMCKCQIHKLALRCKHCKSWIGKGGHHLDQDSGQTNRVFRMAMKGGGVFDTWMPGDNDEYHFDHPESWRCTQYKDWTTYNPRTRRVLVRERCVELYSGEERNRTVGSVRVTQQEADEWFADNA